MLTIATSWLLPLLASISCSFSFDIIVLSCRQMALVKENVLMNYQILTRNVVGDL